MYKISHFSVLSVTAYFVQHSGFEIKKYAASCKRNRSCAHDSSVRVARFQNLFKNEIRNFKFYLTTLNLRTNWNILLFKVLVALLQITKMEDTINSHKSVVKGLNQELKDVKETVRIHQDRVSDLEG